MSDEYKRIRHSSLIIHHSSLKKMGKAITWISSQSVITDWLDFSGEQKIELQEPTLKKWADTAISRMVTGDQYTQRIICLDVRNHSAELPADFKWVIQAAYRQVPTCRCGDHCTCQRSHQVLREEVAEFTQKSINGCDLKISVDCPRCQDPVCSCHNPVIEVDAHRIYQNSNPQLMAGYMKHFHSYGNMTARGRGSVYHPHFFLMSRTTNSLFNVPYHINSCINLNCDSTVEYDIVNSAQGSLTINLNVPDGQVLLSYMGNQVDAEGYRLVPNEPIVFKTINYYIEERLAYQDYRRSREAKDERFWQHTEKRYNDNLAIAKAELRMPSYDEMKAYVDTYWKRIIPNWKGFRTEGAGRQGRFRPPNQTYNP